MSATETRNLLTRDNFDAVLFDLDGVVTATSMVHFAAWKDLFDGYLSEVATRETVPFVPFEDADYRLYVDGKPRYEGVRSFLESRHIQLEYGDPDDPEDRETVCGLGNRKNLLFNQRLAEDGAEVFQTSVELIHQLRTDGIKVAVVSSSKNCVAVLDSAGISDLFDVRFDGKDAARLELTGKPDPDTYLKAAEMLGVEAARAVVVEDAISGVQAGRNGGFGLIIGVARADDAADLRENGAHVVVADLGELLR